VHVHQKRPVLDSANPPLSLVRRLDWRFLLPEGLPESVAFVGEPGSLLWNALQTCYPELVTVPPAKPTAPSSGRFRLVVAQAPSRERLHYAASLVATGGWLYCESQRWGCNDQLALLRPLRPGSSMNRRAIRGELTALGFAAIAEFWHFRNFEDCRCILPLDAAAVAFRHLVRDSDRFVVRVLAYVAQVPGVARLLSHIVPCVSVVGRRGPLEEEPG
jgi:hypothetical protein